MNRIMKLKNSISKFHSSSVPKERPQEYQIRNRMISEKIDYITQKTRNTPNIRIIHHNINIPNVQAQNQSFQSGSFLIKSNYQTQSIKLKSNSSSIPRNSQSGQSKRGLFTNFQIKKMSNETILSNL